MKTTFEMVAKTFQGLEDVLAEELRGLGAADVTPGKRMVSFRGDLEMMYRANMCCRTALRILKPFAHFTARDADELYDRVKEFDWSSLMTVDQTFSIDTVAFSDEFRHSQFVTYRVKDGIVDWFRDHLGDERRPRVRLEGADIMINVHISGRDVTLSLDSSGESLHKRGYRKAQTEAPINEVLAAGIILMSGWRGETPFVDPMCGSGTFLIEAALIAANINPGIFRSHFSFENWPDFDPDLLEEIYNDDSADRAVTVPIVGADISPRAIAIATENAKSAGVMQYLSLEVRPIAKWEQAPAPAGVLVTNPPYGKRIGADDMNALYSTIGTVLKHVFTGYHAWIIGYTDEYFNEIGLAPSQRVQLNNGGLDCELREYVIFEGSKRQFRAGGGAIKRERPERDARPSRPRKPVSDRNGDDSARRPYRPRKQYESDRADTPSTRPFRRRESEGEKTEKQERRPLNLSRLGRQPSIPESKEIVLRPAWRARRKKDNDDSNKS
ncbi:MAG: RNA methyltransferase [Muribaculaceae bacterium]|nr:RNA methyltransferase [Muribaculaceae bacterium]